MWLNNLMNGVVLSIYYDWQNDGTNQTYTEHHFGMVSQMLPLSPALVQCFSDAVCFFTSSGGGCALNVPYMMCLILF